MGGIIPLKSYFMLLIFDYSEPTNIKKGVIALAGLWGCFFGVVDSYARYK